MKEDGLNFYIQAHESERTWPELVVAEKKRLEAEGYTVAFSCLGEMIVTKKEATP